jgi:PhnB protein
MTTRLNPYLGFRNDARQAMEFYRSVFGGDLVMNSFADFQQTENPADADKIMHAQLETPRGFTLMASDTPSGMDYTPGTNHSISLSGDPDDEDELRGYWNKLVDGGTVAVPLEKAPWGDIFGMCTDRFGVAWMVDIGGAQQ